MRSFRTVNGNKIYSDLSNPTAAVTLATPTIESAIRNPDGSIKLTWSKASGADRYNVYRATSENGEYEFKASVLGGELTYTDTEAVGGTAYYYKVRAYKKFDDIVYYGQYSGAKYVSK